MKNICYQLIILLFIILIFPHLGASQDNSTFELRYEVNRIYPPLSLTKEKLNEACTIADINKYYKPSWVKEYISVEVLAYCEGKIRSAVSKNDTFNQAQKDIMNSSDTGTNISVNVQYIPNNTLKYNDAKEIAFSFIIEPEKQAAYSGEKAQLERYLEENVADKIADTVFNIYNLTAVKFSIDEAGQIMDVHIFESSKNKETDELLLEAIHNMPNWTPAEYANGMNVKQEFVLTAGDHRSCVINLLNIHRD